MKITLVNKGNKVIIYHEGKFVIGEYPVITIDNCFVLGESRLGCAFINTVPESEKTSDDESNK